MYLEEDGLCEIRQKKTTTKIYKLDGNGDEK
jgi:hypothetical protein